MMWQMLDVYEAMLGETHDIYTWFHIFINGRVAFLQFRRRMAEVEPNVLWNQLGKYPRPVSITEKRQPIPEDDEQT